MGGALATPEGRRRCHLPGSASEEEDFLGDDLDRVAFDALAVGPLRVVEAALHLDQVALLLVLGDRGAEAVESGDAVEFSEGFGVAGLVLDRLAVDQLGAIGDDGERGDRGLAGVAGFGSGGDGLGPFAWV